MEKDTVLDLSSIDINEYDSSRYGFEMEGWFNDGGWNTYKRGGNPTALETITVKGWTNLYCMVTDYNNVVVYGVTNGDKDGAEKLYEGKTLYGTNLAEYLDANAGVAERSGYTLDKWYNWDYYGHKFEDGRQVSGWTNVYVTYTDGTGNESVFADEVYNIPLANKGTATPAFGGDYTRPGYTFAGWSPKIASTVTESVTYEAQWTTNNYTLTLDPNGGTLNGSTGVYTMYVEYGDRISLSSIKPVRTGYTFQGWNPEVAETVTGNVIYTAHWTANTYTITLVNGEESTTMEVTYGQPIGELPNLENAHSDFEGWFDENGNQVTGDMVYTRTDNMTLTAKWTGHVMTKVEAVAPTCTEDGNTAYWYCADCDKYYSDESCTVEIALEDTVVPATGHHAVKTEAKAATCTEDGNIAYWYCPDCGKYFADEACTQEITLESTVIKALGHDYEDGKCTVCGEKDPDYVQPTDPEGPDQTGENTNVALLVSLLVLSAACLAVVITKSRQWKVR